MMRTPRVQAARGRGMVRGLFVCAMTLSLAIGCKPDKPAEPSEEPSVLDVGQVDSRADEADVALIDSGDAAATVDGSTAESGQTPAELRPPWKSLAPSWGALRKSVADTKVGTLTGEVYGDAAPVRAVIKNQCGAGAILQVVWENDDGLWVTPPMPVRFVRLATKKPVNYTDGAFDITVNFSEDSAERLAGNLKITYMERGEEKTYADLSIDAEPLTMLIEPRMPGEGTFPELPSCHPSGRFYARFAGGDEKTGYLNATASSDGDAMVVRLLLDEQTGLRIMVARRDEDLTKPVTVDLEKPAPDLNVRLVVEAFYTPELTAVEEAEGPNLGREQKVNAHQGKARMRWREKSGRPHLDVRFENLVIPGLLDGPLRGTTFEELRIDAEAFQADAYPDPPSSEPLEASTTKPDAKGSD